MDIRRPKQIFNFIICTDILKDITNKYSIIGTYTNDIVVGEFPARLRLALYADFLADDTPNHKVDFRLTIDNEEPLFIKGELRDSTRGQITALAVNNLEALIPKPGEIKVEVQIDSGKWVTITRKKVLLGTVAELSTPPS